MHSRSCCSIFKIRLCKSCSQQIYTGCFLLVFFKRGLNIRCTFCIYILVIFVFIFVISCCLWLTVRPKTYLNLETTVLMNFRRWDLRLSLRFNKSLKVPTLSKNVNIYSSDVCGVFFFMIFVTWSNRNYQVL